MSETIDVVAELPHNSQDRTRFGTYQTRLTEEQGMNLACQGCDWATEAETADELHAAMMAHGDEAHSSHFDGKTPDEIQEMKKMMDGHVHQMIVDQN